MSTSSKRGRWLTQRQSRKMKESHDEIWCGAFPDNVVVEILSRLPPKPFYRSKCVSKTWLALSSCAFRLNELLQPSLRGLFFEAPTFYRRRIGFTNISDGGPEVDATLSVFSHYDEVRIIDCCNGLLLVNCCTTAPSFSSRDMFVCNPATRQQTAVELLPKEYFEDETYSETFSLAFDPQDKSHFHVVCFMQWHCPCLSYDDKFLVISSTSGSWQRGGSLERVGTIAENAKGTFLDGRVYRITEGRDIVCIDPKNNTCLVTTFKFPGLSFKKGFSEIGQSQGLLHFMSLNDFS